ncbi:murein L,D-transpeptidase family protein [Acaryochloris marina]|uniref:L,D-transpeptidase family protein n=1 Tax=Acaryochloris marina TaxID=155978 RepID=UPI001BB01735|nr:L,D-transpeptidase [Acaryochloris marina]QUY42958.1 L,D-transpeptidase [Acaryochloris marina S15]
MKLSTKRLLFVGIFLLACVGLYGVFSKLGLVFSLTHFPEVLCGEKCAPKGLHQPPVGDGLINGDQAIATLMNLSTLDSEKITLLIEKSKFRLTVYYDQKPLKSYPVVLGSAPTGDKLREGDRKTPEGLFQIQDKYPHPSWSKFLWINYPTADSWRKHLDAKRQGKIKVSDTVGSEIGIHGVPVGSNHLVDQRQNWTWGCISLKNQDVDELYGVVSKGTWIEILP